MQNFSSMHKGLMKILDDGTFPLKAREVASFHAVYVWARDELPKLAVKPKKPAAKKKVEEGK